MRFYWFEIAPISFSQDSNNAEVIIYLAWGGEGVVTWTISRNFQKSY